ncbi:MAG TPA: response regulator [Candidatus Acidoferrales bacterium]|nr:response regulator [Candidatus Acidoferrales bacterium]
MPAQPAPASSQPARILLIEDEPAVAAFLRSALERRGYQIVSSASAAEGLELLASHEFRGVISDFRTPGGMTGADVHAWLLCHKPELSSRVIFITGDTASPETTALLAKAEAPWVEKPFRVQELIAAVEKTIGKP